MRMDGEGDAGIILGNILCILSRDFSCEHTRSLGQSVHSVMQVVEQSGMQLQGAMHGSHLQKFGSVGTTPISTPLGKYIWRYVYHTTSPA